MLALRLTFPWGRYYAHPWGLNPARLREAEWPPSPWRLLRALAAGWFRAYPGCAPASELRRLLEMLGRELPYIAIGPVTFSQAVHWQPNFGATKEGKRDAVQKYLIAGAYKRTRHENHFVATETPVVFRWNSVTLEEEYRSLLDEILPHISYLGRAESICKVERIEDGTLPGDGWCRPCLKDGEPIRRISEDCRDLFCPNPNDFQADDLWSRREGRSGQNPTDAPPHLVEELLAHQPLPDGARWVSYQMPEGWPGRWVVRVAKAKRHTTNPSPAPRVARYLRFSLQCRVPVPLKFTVPLAERFRAQAIRHFSKIAGNGVSSFAFSGHDKPEDAVGEHQHAFYLPLGHSQRQESLLEELHVWCPYGFTQREIEALMRVERLDWGKGQYPIRPVLMAIGNTVPDDCPIAAGQISSRVWRSRTPFVPPRYFYRGNLHGAKLKVKDTPEQQLAQCLKQAGLIVPGEIRRLALNGAAQQFIPPASDWDIVRAPEGEVDLAASSVVTAVHIPTKSVQQEKVRRIGLFFEIAFDAPVVFSLPALGHSSHFGLGQFVPADSKTGKVRREK